MSAPSNKKNIAMILLMLLLAAGMMAFGYINLNRIPAPEYPQFKGAFSLHNDQRDLTFADLHGKVGVVFLGYTHCPDVCPTTLGLITAALKELDEEERAKVLPVFIGVDVPRDTVAIVSQYTRFFSPQIVGVTGSRQEIDQAARSFMFAHQQEESNFVEGYALSHSTYIYIVRPDGELGGLVGHAATPQELAGAIRKWIKWAD